MSSRVERDITDGATIGNVSFDSTKHILTMTGFNSNPGSALDIKWM